MRYHNINYRVKPTAFRDVCDSVRDHISPAAVELLRRIHVLHLFELPRFLPNNSLIYELFSCWNIELESFQIKGKLLKLTVEDISLIVGLPNEGELLHWEGKSIAKETSISLKHKMKQINANCSTNELVRTFLQFVISNLFFISCNHKIAGTLLSCGENADIFSRYNWAEGIFRYLKSQLDGFNNRRKCGGYVSGFITVLMIWFLEHCNVRTPDFPDRRPRLLRWCGEINWSPEQIASTLFSLEGDQIYGSIQELTPIEEKPLQDFLLPILPSVAPADPTESPDSRPPPTTEVEEIRKTLAELVSTEQLFRAEIRTKLDLLFLQVSGMESRISRLEEMNMSMHTTTPSVPPAVVPDDIPAAQFEEPATTPSGTMDMKEDDIPMLNVGTIARAVKRRLSRKRKPVRTPYTTGVITKTAKIDRPQQGKPDSLEVVNLDDRADKMKPAEVDMHFVGRNEVPADMLQILDQAFKRFRDRDDTIFFDKLSNVSLSRRDLDELLSNKYLSDSHIDGFAVMLAEKRDMAPDLYFKFLYVSTLHWHYRRCNYDAVAIKLVSKITATAVSDAKFLFIPIAYSNHWTLLVAHLGEKKWRFYDSLPNVMHRVVIPEVIDSFNADCSKFFEENIREWQVEIVDEAPQQENGYDCGMYVCKYMDTLVSNTVVNWADFEDWPQKMPFFRASLAYELVCKTLYG